MWIFLVNIYNVNENQFNRVIYFVLVKNTGLDSMFPMKQTVTKSVFDGLVGLLYFVTLALAQPKNGSITASGLESLN